MAKRITPKLFGDGEKERKFFLKLRQLLN